MSKKKRKSGENEDESGNRTNEWIGRLILMAVGVIVISAAWKSIVGWALGLPFVLGPLFEAPEFRLVFKLTINRVSGKQVFQIQDVRNSTVYQGGYHYHEAPSQKEKVKEPKWMINREFDLGGDEYQDFRIPLKRGNHLVGSVESDGTVSCYLLGPTSFRSFKDEYEFNSEWDSEDVTRTEVSYNSPQSRTLYFVVQNEDEDEPVSVQVKLRIG